MASVGGRELAATVLVIVLGAIGSLLAITTVSVAFPAIGAGLGSGLDLVQWVATGYLLGLAAMIAATGWLAKRLGPRRLYLGTLAAFAAASALCALAPTIETLIIGRALQGAAGGATLPVGQMLLAQAAGRARMSRVMALVGVPMVLAPTFGPTVGGLLIDAFGWRAIFTMNVPLVLAALVLGARVLPPAPAVAHGRFDAAGFALLGTGAVLLVLGLAEAGSRATVLHPLVLSTALAGVALIAGFVRHARARPDPLLDLAVWRNRGFATCAAGALLVSAPVFGSLVLLPLFLQFSLGSTPLEAGLQLIPQGVGTALSLALGGWLADRIGGGIVTLAGVALLVVGSVPLVVFASGTPSGDALSMALFVRGLGIGAAIIPAIAVAYSMLPLAQIPDATPQLNMLQRVGGALGTALLTMTLNGRLAVDPDGAYAVTFALATALVSLAAVPAGILAVLERRERRLKRAEPIV